MLHAEEDALPKDEEKGRQENGGNPRHGAIKVRHCWILQIRHCSALECVRGTCASGAVSADGSALSVVKKREILVSLLCGL